MAHYHIQSSKDKKYFWTKSGQNIGLTQFDPDNDLQLWKVEKDGGHKIITNYSSKEAVTLDEGTLTFILKKNTSSRSQKLNLDEEAITSINSSLDQSQFAEFDDKQKLVIVGKDSNSQWIFKSE
ncbi:6082_t:CDS:2 [Cetraspora pellucida]|uniref:6082_t:CDS:1 n=1 Tax=Cetraspora pellucida TaxID=1433469 RepID=A0ACA9JZ40_9GLOM|nr:6082_t:CDS:2 [Cetraspora pellucida]